MESLTRQQVRGIDRCAIETVGLSGAVLMENAGRNVADVIERTVLTEGLSGRRVAVVAGGGNNGGDGFVIARHLAMRGACLRTYLVSDPGMITGDARTNLDAIRKLGQDVRVIPADCDIAGLARD